jgi:endogenous inhibitor of DNA gyrase (YacG/DUF329 family)
MIDLGAWFGEDHRIPGAEGEPEVFPKPDQDPH